MTDSNPIERLLDALPAAVAKEKRALIQAELEDEGSWEHYRQNVSKPGRLNKISLRAAVVFKRHLGLTDNFFVGSAEEQEKDISRIVRQYYDQLVSAQ